VTSDSAILVPVAQSTDLRETVDYAVDAALADGPGRLHFVYVHPSDTTDRLVVDSDGAEPAGSGEEQASELLERVRIWATEDAGDRAEELQVETAQIGANRYIFSPEEVARLLVGQAHTAGCDRVIFDPEYDPGIGAPLLQPLKSELERLSDLAVEEARTTRPARRGPLLSGSTPLQVGVLFGISFLFYQALSGSLVLFDFVTGAISATIVAVALSRVTFAADPTRFAPLRLLRMILYIPYLLWEILKANVAVSAVILHPRLPIEPRMTRIRPAVWGAFPVTTLANSITLTPGTLTVRMQGQHLAVHTLIPSAREDLFDGGLERAVRFVFYGRRAARIASLRERGETEILQSPDGGAAETDVATAGNASAENEHGGDGG